MAGAARRRFPVKGTGRTFCAYIPGMRMAMGVNLIRVREVLSIPQPMESNATRLGDLEIDLDPNPRFCVAQYGSRTLESLSGVSGCQVSMSGTQGRYIQSCTSVRQSVSDTRTRVTVRENLHRRSASVIKSSNIWLALSMWWW